MKVYSCFAAGTHDLFSVKMKAEITICVNADVKHSDCGDVQHVKPEAQQNTIQIRIAENITLKEVE